MSIIGYLLGRWKWKLPWRTVLPPDTEQFFEHVLRLLEDEDYLNAWYPERIRDQILGGPAVDELPDAVGEFGRSTRNPIPVNGMVGELAYLSSLRLWNGHRLLFHRLGSIDLIDVYEAVTIDGSEWDILYLSMYHPRRSRKAPTGYSLQKYREQSLLLGTNLRLSNFPYGLREAISATTREIFGRGMTPKEVRHAEESIEFERPPDHVERLMELIPKIEAWRAAD